MMLPAGTITFLFTDIAGSTKLWEAFPIAMASALARHDALMRDVVAAEGGVVFKTIGDAICAAFSTAPDAIQAALSAQRALQTEPWNLPEPLRVRMALHTGTAEIRDNDYFGQTLNRVARLLAIGHGEQILLSLSTQELGRDTLPDGASLRALGMHRLKDLARPEGVFQLCHPDLPDDFPLLRSLDNPQFPNNLPQQVTRFIGRESEVETVRGLLLGKTRLLTLIGSGGSGKTRLSLQVAAELLEEYPDGIWFVELAALTDPSLVVQTVAGVLDVREEAGKTLTQRVTEHLRVKHVLLILDNCEHLLTACAQLAETLIRNCLHITIFASSREGLGIVGEQTYRVPSLSLPEASTVAAQTLETVSQYEAVRLFIDRALSMQPTFAVTNANAPAVAQLCIRLDGIPFAIELAAARVRSLTVTEINDRLDNRFRLLTSGSRTALPRQQTLRAMIDWSYDLLTPPEKVLLTRLSVFAGGWTLVAAEQICADDDTSAELQIEEWEMLDLLTSLVDKSLVVSEPREEGSSRYRLLETVRQYARDRLVETGEKENVRERHQRFFLNLAEMSHTLLRGPDQAIWLQRLEREHDNLRVAMDWVGTRDENAASASRILGLRIASILSRFWYLQGYTREGRERLSAALAQVDTLAPDDRDAPIAREARARALRGAGVLAHAQGNFAAAETLYAQSLILHRGLGDRQGIADSLGTLAWAAYSRGDYAAARPLQEESLSLFREMGDKQKIASSLGNLGLLARTQGDYDSADRLHEESLALARELGDKRGIALALLNRGWVAQERGDWRTAHRYHEESLTISEELGDKRGIALSLLNQGWVYRSQGDVVTARDLYEQSLVLSRELGDKQGICDSLSNLGLLLQEQGDAVAASTFQAESLVLAQEIGDKRGIVYSLEAFAILAVMGENTERAARLWGAAMKLRQTIGSPRPPSEQADYERWIEQARTIAGEARFVADWNTGHNMTMSEAVTYALSDASAPASGGLSVSDFGTDRDR